MTKWKIYNEDAVEWARHYSKKKFHALLCDPPYHLTSITKRFGKKNSAPAKYGTDGVFSRSSSGFMGQTWDGGDVAFDPETWTAFGEVLYPGAFGMAFSSSRSWHRLAVAIEDAGFIIHPTIFLWSYGSGFPKATNISKQLDKGIPNGKITSVTGNRKSAFAEIRKNSSSGFYGEGKENYDLDFTDPTANAWKGHRYGLQALKPACEPIIVFQKPYEGKSIDNIVETGAGTLNIDGGRVGLSGMEEHKTPAKSGLGKHGVYGKSTVEEITGKDLVRYTSSGRWPANFILDEEAAKHLDEQSGDVRGFSGGGTKGAGFRTTYINGENKNVELPAQTFNDSGGASRFFYTVSSQLDESDPVYYCSKVSGKEREAGLENFESKNFAQSGGAQSKESQGEDEYLQDSIVSNRITKRKNIHPTCKPIDLARYLATLLLPPADYAPRKILVPFSGVASEMIGCGLAGWEQIVGVEFDKENGYIDIANARLEHWLNK